MGYIGGGLLFLVNVLMYLNPSLFGFADEVAAIKAAFVSVGVWWVLFTIPLMIFVREPKENTETKALKVIRSGLRQFIITFKAIRDLKVVGTFLLAYWFYIDGVDTIIRMAVDYGSALGFPASSLIVALLITQFVAFPSAIAYNVLGSKVGVKKALYIAIVRLRSDFHPRILHECRMAFLCPCLHDRGCSREGFRLSAEAISPVSSRKSSQLNSSASTT